MYLVLHVKSVFSEQRIFPYDEAILFFFLFENGLPVGDKRDGFKAAFFHLSTFLEKKERVNTRTSYGVLIVR